MSNGLPHFQIRIPSFSQQTIVSHPRARLLSSQHRRGHLIYLAISFLTVRWAAQRDLQDRTALTWVHAGANQSLTVWAKHLGAESWLATKSIHHHHRCSLASHSLLPASERSRGFFALVQLALRAVSLDYSLVPGLMGSDSITGFGLTTIDPSE